MKRRAILCLILTVGFMLSTTAKQRTLQEIKQGAMSALTNQNSRRAASLQEADLDILKQNTQLTIVGGKAGFAVIANDDQFPAVLGYSEKEWIDGDVAPGFLWWVDAITEQMEYNLEHNLPMAAATPAESGYPASVDKLMVTEWGQGEPFNNETPTYKSGSTEVHYVTGCVATAMAQIMYYHTWPEKGKGTVSYYFTPEGSETSQKLTANLAKTPYAWDKMLPSYKNGYTQEEADAVSMLMLHCGYSVNMQYTKTGSGAFTSDAADALRKRFYYNQNMHFYWRDYFPVEEWMDKIFSELSEGYPVLYGAQSSSGGHEFVLHGYNDKGQVYVNWGWNGSQDGFFDIASLNGYSYGQEMVLVHKNDADIPYQSYWGMHENGLDAKLLGTSLSASFYAMNFDYNKFTGKIGLLAQNLATKEITVLDSDDNVTAEYMNEDENGNHLFMNFSYSANITSLASGTYRIYGGSLATKDTDWQPIRIHETSNNSYLLTIDGDNASLQKENNPNWTEIRGIKSEISINNDNRYYDLQGREVKNLGKGIYIYKGKKVVR